ncbi:MAG: glutamate 5-kinase [Myxococcota bacterium]
MKRVVIKIGSQTIVDAKGTLNIHRMAELIRQIAILKESGFAVVLVTSGAVASGTGLLPISSSSDVVKKQILASLGQAKLIETYNFILKHYGLMASQILLTKEDFKTQTHNENITHLFGELLLQQNILPIVNENDTVAITELMFTDNDELASLVAEKINADCLVILTNVNGVYDQDPANPSAKVIAHLQATGEAWPEISASKSQHGRGGMQSKLTTARKLAALGINTHIANADEPNVLLRLIAEKERLGTEITP